MSNVDPEEARAILGGPATRASDVAPRDFRQPRRLSGEERQDLERVLEARLPDVARELSEGLGQTHALELVSLGEADAEGVFRDEPAEPLTVLRFRSRQELAWLVWENEAAVAAAERLLGSGSDQVDGRPLSSIEVSVLTRVLADLARSLCAVFGLPSEDACLVQKARELGDWREAPAPDPHRLELELSLSGRGDASTLRLFLPGFQVGAASPRAREEPAAPLPAHMNRVTVELQARLEGCEVSLAQLLALEPGDVIPIDAHVGDAVQVTVGDQPYAEALLGRHGKRLAIRIEHITNRMEP